jgi:hypothetical protein
MMLEALSDGLAGFREITKQGGSMGEGRGRREEEREEEGGRKRAGRKEEEAGSMGKGGGVGG